MPLGFFSTIDVEVALAMGIGAIPLRVEVEPVELNIALAASLLSTFNLKNNRLHVLSKDRNNAIKVSTVQDIFHSSQQK